VCIRLVRSHHLTDTSRVPVAHLIQNVGIGRGICALAEDPGVTHNLITVKARVWINDKQLADEVFSFARDGLP